MTGHYCDYNPYVELLGNYWRKYVLERNGYAPELLWEVCRKVDLYFFGHQMRKPEIPLYMEDVR